DRGGRGTRDFAVALEALTGRLARMLVQDGEGATKLVSITVRGAASRRDALIAARSVANSPLVKAAINGQDPNWGRIMMALGKSAARVEQDKVAINFADERQSERLVERGMLREGVLLPRVREIMGGQAYDIIIDLGIGRGEERVWTCDLSEEYVRINAKYTTYSSFRTPRVVRSAPKGAPQRGGGKPKRRTNGRADHEGAARGRGALRPSDEAVESED